LALRIPAALGKITGQPRVADRKFAKKGFEIASGERQESATKKKHRRQSTGRRQ